MSDRKDCRCISCGSCRGTGTIWISILGSAFDDPEPCDDCNGSGITELCDRCAEIQEES